MKTASSLFLAGALFVACSGGAETDLDGRATAIRKDLGPLCSNFDFQTKLELEGDELRPVHCSGDDGVTLQILVFQDQEHLEAAWRDVPEPQEAVDSGDPGPVGLVTDGGAATVVIFDRSLLDEAEQRLDR